MRVICINDSAFESKLTHMKEYDVSNFFPSSQDPDSDLMVFYRQNYFWVNDDSGTRSLFPQKRFKLISIIREEKLNQLL